MNATIKTATPRCAPRTVRHPSFVIRHSSFGFLLALCLLAGCSQVPKAKERSLIPPLGKDKAASSQPEAPLPSGETAKVCLATAEQMEQSGHLREAAALYERARQHQPRAADYSRRLAVLYERLNEPQRARTEYELALVEKPKDPDLLNDFGYFHYGQGDLAEAEQRLRQALALAPGHERAQVNLGVVLASQGRYQDAYEVFARVVGPAAAHSNVGAIMAKQGRREEAIAACRLALAHDPSLEPSQVMLASLTATASSPPPSVLGGANDSALNRPPTRPSAPQRAPVAPTEFTRWSE